MSFMQNTTMIKTPYKTPPQVFCGGVSVTGNNLSSQAASSPVLSTRGSLTAVFGMGTGGASQPSSPDLWMVFSAFCFVRLRLARSIYASIISRRSPCLPCIRSENPHPFLQVLPDPQYRTEETTYNKLTCLFAFKSSPRRISTGPLNTLLHLHSRPINLVFYKASY